jgi:hypothetical protein
MMMSTCTVSTVHPIGRLRNCANSTKSSVIDVMAAFNHFKPMKQEREGKSN